MTTVVEKVEVTVDQRVHVIEVITAGPQGPPGAGGVTSEQIQDIVAAMLVPGANVTIDYDDAAGKININSTGGGGSTVSTIDPNNPSVLILATGPGHTIDPVNSNILVVAV